VHHPSAIKEELTMAALTAKEIECPRLHRLVRLATAGAAAAKDLASP
jgi:hypothetical protein